MNLSVGALLIYSIVGAAVSIYIPFLVVALARIRVGFDTSAPRAAFDRLPDYGKRATWAHQNSFETFPAFAAAALAAYVTGVNEPVAGLGAIAFVVARLLYSLFYITAIAIARSLAFGIGTLCTYLLFGLSLMHIQ